MNVFSILTADSVLVECNGSPIVPKPTEGIRSLRFGIDNSPHFRLDQPQAR